MAEELQALHRRCEFTKAKIARIKTNLIKADEIAVDEYVLDTFLRTIDAAYLDMNDCQAKLFAAMPHKQEEEEQEYFEFEQLYTEVRAEVCRQLDRHKKQELQVHSGLQLVSNAPQIRCLIGEAAGAINQQFINANNFDGAWNFLQQRYEDKRKIVDIHASRLLQLKPMTQESGKQLRELIEECVRHIDSLRYNGYDALGLSDILLMWKATNKHSVIPTYADTISFLEKHTQVLERVEASQQKVKQKPSAPVHAQKLQTKSTTITVTSATKCVFCEKAHFNHQCEELLKLSATDRNAKAKQAGVCYNCLRKGHMTAKCSSKHSCRDCNKRHHTVLHIDIPKPSDDTCKTTDVQSTETGKASTNTSNVVTLNCATSTNEQEAVLLSTAIVNILDVHGQNKLCRVLLDSGSQLHLITEAMASLLGISRNRCSISVVGINGKETPVKHMLAVQFGSRINGYIQQIECLVVPRIANILPASKLNVSDCIIPDGVLLADPNFYKPQRIDLLIGAQLFFHILRTGQIQLGDKLLVLQETTLGWLIQRFWELEEVPLSTKLSSEEELCEQHYHQTTTRDISGRYVVRLPFRNTTDQLGDSRQQVLQRFGHLERRLATNSELKEQYDFFMEKYIRNHCKETPESEVSSSPNFYLPHHAILKPTSSSTKLRTVFDASAKSSSGVSLNDLLMIGPAVQDSLLNIVMRFRIPMRLLKRHIQNVSPNQDS
ncbi:uncharacterized protein LOC131688002 [Topomyia yanbarensis]|uniref:uncharacterized protein LOC131688002 n=1 Tax=Topomyia yanbarensis TaxID=2498891 RepID=UPI00273AFD90|nr:uncharacterized protein LOC131688002 [Topomyia yanbarensis]